MVDRIKALCNAQKMSLNDLESSIGLGINTIYKWDNASPAADKLEKVANFFNVSTDYLLGRENEPRILLAAAAHFDVDKLTDEGREQYEAYITYLAEKFSKE